MEATPLEQVAVVAVATYSTGEPNVVRLAGLVTVTPANDGKAKIKRAQIEKQRRFTRVFLQIFD